MYLTGSILFALIGFSYFAAGILPVHTKIEKIVPEEREGYLIACKNLFLAGALALMCFKWAGETRWWAAAGTAAVVVGSVLLLNRKKAGCWIV